MTRTVAVVDDEPDIVELVSLHLKKSSFNVKCFSNGSKFLAYIKSSQPDLVILDLMLPDADGLEICRYMRKTDRLSSIPLIMLTAKTEESDKVCGLELGADDYITKPFSPRELIARVKALLRRATEVADQSSRLESGDIVLDLQKHSVTVKGQSIELTSTEFRILHLLMSRKGWVFARGTILDHLWSDEKIVVDRTVDVHIRHLREKLGVSGNAIKNVRGVGYKLEE
jgi:two-component system phosphate regulon response regulator PhoB/two-component system alkaline phosphatase synthesis response regulator PhoP